MFIRMVLFQGYDTYMRAKRTHYISNLEYSKIRILNIRTI